MKLYLYFNRFPGLVVSAIAFLMLLTGRTVAQNEDKIKAIIISSDLKKLEKAEKYKADADKLMEEANQLYLETFAVQGNNKLDEKTIRKKVKQLEGQARGKITEASGLYQKCNEIKYGLYKTYIEKFWSGNKVDESQYINARLLEEQSNDYYYQAITNRSEANKMPDGNEKIQKLNQANELEIQAIDKQLSALSHYYNISFAETQVDIVPTAVPSAEPTRPLTEVPSRPDVQNQPSAVQQPETTVHGQIVINQQMIDMYNRYISSQGRSEDSLPISGLANISSFDADRIIALWYAYLNGSVLENAAEPQMLASSNEIIPDSAEHVLTATENQAGQPQETEEQIAVVENERQAQLIPDDENIIYRVQIAANKTELNQRVLQNIYYGNKNVEMIEENGWYKYSVGDFNTYADARAFRKSCNVKNAFIVAYRKGKPFIPGSKEDAVMTALPLASVEEKNMPSGLVFRIQLAASRAPFTKEQLSKIYPGNYSVEMIEEEGWYKYQLMGVRLYSDALGILKDIPIKGAFISAYEDGIKINLYEGAIKNRNLEKIIKASGRKDLRETEFHVQLAASKYPIKPEEFVGLYSGSLPIALIIEEGWYKYRIKAGNSYDQAKKIKSECGIEKAFIVAYKRARKIALIEAIREMTQ